MDIQKQYAVQESSYLIIFHPPSQKNVNDIGMFTPALNNHHLLYLTPATLLDKGTIPEYYTLLHIFMKMYLYDIITLLSKA
jgi:hypothetical protein